MPDAPVRRGPGVAVRVRFVIPIWMIPYTRGSRLQFEAVVDLVVDHPALDIGYVSWAGRQAAALGGRDSASIDNFGQRASICPLENPVAGSELMPLVRTLALSVVLVATSGDTVLSAAYRCPYCPRGAGATSGHANMDPHHRPEITQQTCDNNWIEPV